MDRCLLQRALGDTYSCDVVCGGLQVALVAMDDCAVGSEDVLLRQISLLRLATTLRTGSLLKIYPASSASFGVAAGSIISI